MCRKWRISGECKGEKVENKVKLETSLVAKVVVFKGTCHECGKEGHRVHECPNKKPCGLCGSHGHHNQFCWEKEENASKRPSGWTSRLKKKSALESSAVGVEVLVASVEGTFSGTKRASGNLVSGNLESGNLASGYLVIWHVVIWHLASRKFISGSINHESDIGEKGLVTNLGKSCGLVNNDYVLWI